MSSISAQNVVMNPKSLVYAQAVKYLWLLAAQYVAIQ